MRTTSALVLMILAGLFAFPLACRRSRADAPDAERASNKSAPKKEEETDVRKDKAERKEKDAVKGAKKERDREPDGDLRALRGELESRLNRLPEDRRRAIGERLKNVPEEDRPSAVRKAIAHLDEELRDRERGRPEAEGDARAHLREMHEQLRRLREEQERLRHAVAELQERIGRPGPPPFGPDGPGEWRRRPPPERSGRDDRRAWRPDEWSRRHFEPRGREGGEGGRRDTGGKDRGGPRDREDERRRDREDGMDGRGRHDGEESHRGRYLERLLDEGGRGRDPRERMRD